MWNELESYKNHYLQRDIKFIKAKCINELVNDVYQKSTACFQECRMPWKDKCKSSTYFEDHARLAYGFWALPKLLKELCAECAITRWRAVNSLSEYLMNPLHAARAINQADIVRRVYNVIMNLRHNYKKEKSCIVKSDPREVARLLRIFYILSLYMNGARKIVRKPYLLNEFYNMIYYNEVEYKTTVSQILRNFTEKPEIVLYMLHETKAMVQLKRIFHYDPEIPHYDECLWLHLSHFLEIEPQKGLEFGFFELFHLRIMKRLPRYHCLNMKCLALLLSCPEGQQRFDEVDGVRMIYDIFKQTYEGLDTYEYVLLALINCLHSKKALWRCREFTDLPLYVMKCTMIKKRQTINLQLYILQAIKQMCVMPCIKEFVLIHCLKPIKRLKCLNEIIECVRDELVVWLKRKVYDSSSQAKAFDDEY